MSVCQHGFKYGSNSFEGAWAGGVAFCDCCQSYYGFIDSGWGVVAVEGESFYGGTSMDKHLCYPCGGRATSYGHGEYMPGTTVWRGDEKFIVADDGNTLLPHPGYQNNTFDKTTYRGKLP